MSSYPSDWLLLPCVQYGLALAKENIWRASRYLSELGIGIQKLDHNLRAFIGKTFSEFRATLKGNRDIEVEYG
jgi:hypothetical protein